MNTLFVGVDMSKDSFAAAASRCQTTHDFGSFANQASGFTALAQAVATEQERQEVEQVHLIVEATGGYELRLLSFAHEQGWLFSLPNPKQVRDWAKGEGGRNKNDRIDARNLTQFGVQKRPQPQQPVPEVISQLDSLLRRQEDVQKMMREERNRQHALAYHPQAAAAAVASTSRVLAALEAEMQELAEAIQALLNANPQLRTQARRLRTVPGIGAKNNLPILVLLYRWQARTNGQGTAKGLTAFVGLDVPEYSSGISVYKRPTISKMGSPEMRSRLYLGALGGVRGKNSPLRFFYQRLVGRGKAKKLALVAASRKILVWAWAVFSHEVDFDPSRFASHSA